jgi:hypothetical protein
VNNAKIFKRFLAHREITNFQERSVTDRGINTRYSMIKEM